ncbi:MAG: CopG family antitoxin [Dehalococcoidia bacterium]|nr:CopG family antitoxin [Dehalococcoidia bacterium]
MRQKERKAKEPLPEFQSRQEMAEFWDTHDFTDYMDEFKPVKARFAKNLSQPISIRLDPETLTQLRSHAKEKGIGPTTLARMWILEHLRELQGKAGHTSGK